MNGAIAFFSIQLASVKSDLEVAPFFSLTGDRPAYSILKNSDRILQH
ncbi:hypothetical protein IQ238_00045 [Pleurocapsales cyanobacterium LEGE 06147]|nr:hypothetical protein [Pleurocapsales cyanobacterium LEGE 06147]